MQTKKVIQHLKVVDVPESNRLCKCCGEYKSSQETSRVPGGRFDDMVCNTCRALPEDVQKAGRGAYREETRTSKYYLLERDLEEHNTMAGHITVAKLIAQLQEMDPEAHLNIYYSDPDEGDVNIDLDFSRAEKQQTVFGLSYYSI